MSSVVNNTLTTGQSYSLPGSISGTAAKIQVWMTGHPDDLRTNIFVGESDWQEGLTIATEDCLTTSTTCSTRVRWSWTNWTQDIHGGVMPDHLANPRVIESRVGDGTNTRRTTTSYYEHVFGLDDHVAYFGLPSETKVYDTNLSTVLKRTAIEYNGAFGYVSRRIIGLPSKVELYSPTSTLISKATFGYDEGGYDGSGQEVEPSVGHDNGNYGSNLTYRGNRTSSTRWDVNYPTSDSHAVTSEAAYNTAGSVIKQTDPLDRETKFSYTDTFYPSPGVTTYAYPTTITDAAENSSTIRYRYDIGANIEATSPAPAGQTYGKTSKRVYDSVGRIEKDSVLVNATEKFYTRYEYPSNNGVQRRVYSTIADVDNDGNIAEDEAMTESWTDGAGRVRRVRTEHPGSTGGWSAVETEYDMLGRVHRTSVPTEITESSNVWTPAGDDATRGWVWNYQYYDWMGRVTRKINSDGVDSPTINDSDILISYDGCGCAGGLVTTIDGEKIIETDWDESNPVTLGRRRQKVYQDVLGRTWKTEVMGWDGTTVYSTKIDTFNGRDQVISTRQYEGTSSSGTYRDVTMSYDGHGRMLSRHFPIEDNGASTVWSYNDDDSINTVTDPRGVETTFGYYSETGLLHTIEYDVPSGQASNIPDTPNVTFEYDDLGNRTSMTDGMGSVSYSYDPLSQMTAETRTFTGLSTTFTINYTYDPTGLLKTLSDPHNSSRKVVYTHDKKGRVIGAGMMYQSTVTPWVNNAEYRAWGDLKSFDNNMENSAVESRIFNYDDRLSISSYEKHWNYQLNDAVIFRRYSDGNLKFASAYPGDRSYKYDHVGRLTKGYSGRDAHDGDTGVPIGPYKQEFVYNSFSDITSITGKYWQYGAEGYTKSYANYTGRDANTGYDTAGNIVTDRIKTPSHLPPVNRSIKYDAAGRQVETLDPGIYPNDPDRTYFNFYDGNGWKVKGDFLTPADQPTYEIRSTVLGGEVVGTHLPRTYPLYQHEVFIAPVLGGKLTYTKIINYNETTVYTRDTPEGVDYDPRGGKITEEPGTTAPGGPNSYPNLPDPTNYSRCTWEGLAMPCDQVGRMMNLTGYLTWKRRSSAPKASTGTNAQSTARQTGPAQATTATEKPKDDAAAGNVVEPSSVPSSDGDDTIYGPADGESTVTVRGGPSDIEISPTSIITELGNRAPLPVDTNTEIGKAFRGVESILSTAGPCADFFGPNAAAALKALREKVLTASKEVLPGGIGIQQKGDIKYFDAKSKELPSNLRLTASFRVFDVVRLNRTGPFLIGNAIGNRLGGFNHASLGSRMVQILHELAHLVLENGTTPLIPDDHGDPGKNDENTRKILEDKKCLEEVNRQIKKQEKQ